MTAERRFSHAIAEGDGISVIAAVEDADAARAAEAQRAEALVVSRDPAALREATGLPILWRAETDLEQAAEVADAVILAMSDEEERLEAVLELLAAVPAGKLAIADLAVTTEDEVHELERAGVDAVIVHTADVSPLVGDAPPEV